MAQIQSPSASFNSLKTFYFPCVCPSTSITCLSDLFFGKIKYPFQLCAAVAVTAAIEVISINLLKTSDLDFGQKHSLPNTKDITNVKIWSCKALLCQHKMPQNCNIQSILCNDITQLKNCLCFCCPIKIPLRQLVDVRVTNMRERVPPNCFFHPQIRNSKKISPISL